MGETSKVSWVLKYLIFFFNLFFWIMGCLMIGVGTWAFGYKNSFSFESVKEKGAFDFIFDAALILLVIGVFIFILAFAGCIGSLRENTCLLKFFYIALTVVFILEIIGAILAFVFSSQVKQKLQLVMQEEALSRYREDTDLMNMIDFFQKEFGCCGIGPLGFRDWEINPYFKCQNVTAPVVPAESCAVPFSCCINPTTEYSQSINIQCGYGMLKLQHYEASKTIYTEGCLEKAMSLAQMNLHIIGGVAVAVALLQILSIFMTRLLADQIHEQSMSFSSDY